MGQNHIEDDETYKNDKEPKRARLESYVLPETADQQATDVQVILVDLLFEFIDVQDMLSMSQVCLEWRQKLDGNGCFMWQLKSKQLWPELPEPRLQSSKFFKSIKHFVVIKSLVLDEEVRMKRFLRAQNVSLEQLDTFSLNPFNFDHMLFYKHTDRPRSVFNVLLEKNESNLDLLEPNALQDKWNNLSEEDKKPFQDTADKEDQQYRLQKLVFESNAGRALRFKTRVQEFFATFLECLGEEFDADEDEEEENEEGADEDRNTQFIKLIQQMLDNGQNMFLAPIKSSPDVDVPEYWIMPRFGRDPMDPFVFQADERDNRDDLLLSVDVRCVSLDDESDIEVINDALFGEGQWKKHPQKADRIWLPRIIMHYLGHKSPYE